MEYDEVSDFVADLPLKNLSPRTIVEHQKVLASFFDHVTLGDLAPREITAVQLRGYVASLHQPGPAAKTIGDQVIVIKRFLGFLVAEGYI